MYGQNIFAVLGDYGSSGPNETAVANLIKSWNPQYIITMGDNNYPMGATNTIDANIGQYYHNYIKPYKGTYGNAADTNRFFPSLGNHDWMTAGATPYLQYFTLPGNERYYDFIKDAIHFFVLDADPAEPDGVTKTSIQALWLKNKLSTSVEKWKIVYFHHSPYCSDAVHGNQTYMQWPFKSWGADIVLSGHSHIYERVIRDNFPYLVNGLGGQSKYQLATPIQGSKIRYNSAFGAIKVTMSPDTLWFRFYTVSNKLIDAFPLVKRDTTNAIIKIKFPENSDHSINVYPNPSTGLFTFEICLEDAEEEAIGVMVLNPFGQVIFNKTFASNNNCVKEIIALENNLVTGIYLLQIKMSNHTRSAKIVLNR